MRTNCGFWPAIGAFILPYLYVLSPQLLLVDATFFGTLLPIVTSIIGMVSISAALTGYLVDRLNAPFRIVLAAAAGPLPARRPWRRSQARGAG